jgi:hypothetical protein
MAIVHDGFGLNQSKTIVIYTKGLEQDAAEKWFPLFLIPL